MRRLALLAAVAVGSLVTAGAAEAGCMATVGLSPMPQPGIQAGQPWLVNVKVLQHGRTPLAGARPVVRIRSAAGRLIRFSARATATRGIYRARVVFPAAGRWGLSVYDGFPVVECARVHTFPSVTVFQPH
jgi:hypothetical protein